MQISRLYIFCVYEIMNLLVVQNRTLNYVTFITSHQLRKI